jgi:hypothetical protein
MQAIRTFLPFIYALLLLIPTLYGVPSEMFLVFMLVLFWGEREALKSTLNDFLKRPTVREAMSFWMVVLIFVSSLMNKVSNGHEILCKTDYYAAFYLLPFLFLSSKLLKNPNFFKALIYLTIFEVAVGVFQYFSGVRTFFLNLGEMKITDYSLLYSSRVYGLSANSSMLAYKAFLAILLLDIVRLERKSVEWIFRVLLTIGILLSFSRSVILVMTVYWLIQLVYHIVVFRKEALQRTTFQMSALMLGSAILLQGPLRMQLSRNEMQAEKTSGLELKKEDHPKNCSESHALPMSKGETDPSKMGWGDKLLVNNGIQTSGRKQIWLNYINFIENHFWTGNGSDKLMLLSWHPVLQKYKLVHAHNSFIQLLANNGILIFLFYLILFIFMFRSGNFIPSMAIVLYSLANYGIFWGFSYMDLMFFILLAAQIKPLHDDSGAYS